VVEQNDDRLVAEAIAASGAEPTQTMVCPVCGFENLMGADSCANCGADLRTSDIPVASTPFERLLTEVPLSTLQTRPPFIVEATATIAEALKRMRDEKTADVVVVENGRIVGIFTERDAALKLLDHGRETRDLEGTSIRDVMTADPVVLRPDDSIAVAVQKMAVGGFRHIPLVADGRPLGVISAADVFRHILRIVG